MPTSLLPRYLWYILNRKDTSEVLPECLIEIYLSYSQVHKGLSSKPYSEDFLWESFMNSCGAFDVHASVNQCHHDFELLPFFLPSSNSKNILNPQFIVPLLYLALWWFSLLEDFYMYKLAQNVDLENSNFSYPIISDIYFQHERDKIQSIFHRIVEKEHEKH